MKTNNDEKSPTPTPAPLTMQQIQAIGQAYARLMELREQTVLTVNTETEVRGLIEFLSSELLAHANELLACWLVAKTEYEPALRLFAQLSARVDAIKSLPRTKPNIVIRPKE